jgi:predicted signal transduction protein with EAL and GGDEF domain
VSVLLADEMAWDQLAVFILLAVLGAALSAIISTWLAYRRIVVPISILERQVRRVEDGDYTPAPALARNDNIGRLSQAVHDMTVALDERNRHLHQRRLRQPIPDQTNRTAFLQTITPDLAAKRGAFLVVGLIRASEVANTVGREVADRVLRHVGLRLSRLLGNAPLACLGDQTFAVFLRDAGEARARSIAAVVIEHCEAPYTEGDLIIDTVAAVGIALMPVHGTEGAEVLQRAEVALTAGLTSGNNWAIYDPPTDPYRPERLSLMSDLRRGLLTDEFVLFYQPKLHFSTGRITGAEALVRWRHPRRGNVPPDDFVGLAEETGNVRHLTRWVLREGIAQAARWRDAGINLEIAINLSARDLSDARLPYMVDRLLSEHELDPRAVSLEVTESAIMANPAAAVTVVRGFAERKISVALDDFGIGQTSLTHLRILPLRELKIDKAFIAHLADAADDRKIVRSVVELGHSLGLAVTAEGVEDAKALGVLAELGCDYAQGFHISRPLVADMMEVFVQQHLPIVPAASCPL